MKAPSLRALSAAVITTLLTTPSLAQDAAQDMATSMARTACQGYQDSLVNMLRTTNSDLSREATRERNEAPISNVTRQNTIRTILEATISSEPNPELRRILTQAANDYIRSQRVESFERGLNGFVDTCVQIRGQNYQQQPPQNPQSAPPPRQPNTNSRPERGQSTLPARDSYL